MDANGAKPEEGVSVPEPNSFTPPEGEGRIIKSPTKVEESAQKVGEVFDSKLSDVLDTLLAKVSSNQDWRPLKLPSRGKAYVNCDESVMIKPFTFAQERKLRSIKTTNQGTKIINSLVEDCVQGLDYDSMTLEDKNYVLFKLREISYGDDYTITAECSECNNVNKLVVKISEVPVKYAQDDYKEPFTVTLPDSEQQIRFVSPRCKDEEYLESMDKLTDNLWRFALSVGEYSDKKIIKAFLEATTVKDVAFFREELGRDRYGMNKDMSYECAACGAVTGSLIPFTESFFSVS